MAGSNGAYIETYGQGWGGNADLIFNVGDNAVANPERMRISSTTGYV